MNLTQRIQEIRTGFNSNFWIANTLELFERLAFYGAKAELVVFLSEKVGLNEEAGRLAGLFSFVIYLLPIVAGVLVDRYGFKKTLLSCFAIFSLGYFLIGMAGMSYGAEIMEVVGRRTYIITVLMITAVGGSLIKPCIVGTVSKTSKPNAKALGFSIYYTLVNFGGAMGPIIALHVREDWGIEYVLIMSSITSLLLFFGTLLFFKEPEADESDEKRTFGKVLTDMLMVFSNVRFILFLIIFSGFWIMFWQIFLSFPLYVKDVLHFEKFEIMETIDACCIIVLTVPITVLVQKWKPITAMILGFSIASVSWLIIGSSETVLAAVIGIAMFAVGEATQAPRFYEYVSSLAPKGSVGTYMGFAFLPVALGSLTAGIVGDSLRISFMKTDPAMMWFVMAGIGLISTILMILYNTFIAKKISQQ